MKSVTVGQNARKHFASRIRDPEDSLPQTSGNAHKIRPFAQGIPGVHKIAKFRILVFARILLIFVGSIFVEVQRARSSEILAASTRKTVSTSLDRFTFVSPSLHRSGFGRLVRTGEPYCDVSALPSWAGLNSGMTRLNDTKISYS